MTSQQISNRHKTITLIFPNQLFKHHPSIKPGRPIYLAEEYLFFKIQRFHKQKLVLLRAAMQAYADFLKKKGFDIVYIDSRELKKRGDLFTLLHKKGVEEIHLADFPDDWLKKDLEKATHRFHWKLNYYDSPMFLCTEKEISAFFEDKKKFSMAQFYAYQRKKLNILMKNGAPIGGKFSFDIENRKRIPKGYKIPKLPLPKETASIKKAIAYTEKEFPDAIGETKPFIYPTTFVEAEKALDHFIDKRLVQFGDYEDAIAQNEPFLFHSLLSPLLNIGLLTPEQVIEKVLSSHKKLSIPLNALEGFIRQIIGWREFMRACYILKGSKARSSNYFRHKTPIPKGFWDGTTGIKPIDTTIQRILKTGYCHHIERLMILGNFLLLTETNPNKVYDWFMSYFVDAYDWVMVPNVYSMSQYADSGEITTKPYISGANYILKMSDYPKDNWVNIWDGLFWRFLKKHKPLFNKNPRTKMLLKLLDKNRKSIDPKIELANKFQKK